MKKVKIINIIFLFLLSFLWHFMYRWFPNNITAIFFPVNESIWEHMKIIYGVLVFGSLFELFLLNKFKIEHHNFYIEIVVKAIFGVFFYLLIFIPLYKMFGEVMFISIGLLLITYIVVEWIGEKILKSQELNINILPIIIIILGFIMFAILTFYPRHNYLFFDDVKLIYGIPQKK